MELSEVNTMLAGAFNEDFSQGCPQIITPRRKSIPAFRMVYLPGGTFIMGDEKGFDMEKPAHPVKLNPFYMAEFLVSQELYIYVTGKNPSSFKNLQKPVDSVNWFDAIGFCNALSKELGLAEVYKQNKNENFEWVENHAGIRLPTEAEWEYAAKGGLKIHETGKKRNENIYSGSDRLETVGWYAENSHGRSMKNGLKFPNQAGIYDMSGNLWEWCWDGFDEKYYGKCKKQGVVENPRNEKGEYRVLRGGAWSLGAAICRTADRIGIHPRNDWADGGFRFVLGL